MPNLTALRVLVLMVLCAALGLLLLWPDTTATLTHIGGIQ